MLVSVTSSSRRLDCKVKGVNDPWQTKHVPAFYKEAYSTSNPQTSWLHLSIYILIRQAKSRACQDGCSKHLYCVTSGISQPLPHYEKSLEHANTRQQSITLTSLPEELLLEIYEHLHVQDLKTLRLVNKTLGRSAAPHLFEHESFTRSATGDLSILRPRFVDSHPSAAIQSRPSAFEECGMLQYVRVASLRADLAAAIRSQPLVGVMFYCACTCRY